MLFSTGAIFPFSRREERRGESADSQSGISFWDWIREPGAGKELLTLIFKTVQYPDFLWDGVGLLLWLG